MQPKIEDADMTVDTESQLNPTNDCDRAMSFVGTVEYIAPEVIKNEGYAGTVDWWTFGILMYEMMHGKTPFKGKNNEDTFANIFLGTFDFPKDVEISNECKSLLRLLLAKDLNDRLTSPSQIRQHAFFRGTNWALCVMKHLQLYRTLNIHWTHAISVHSIISLNQTKSLWGVNETVIPIA